MKITSPPPPRDSLILRVLCAFAVLLAAFAMTAANAAPISCSVGEYFSINTVDCQMIAQPTGTANGGRDIPGVTLVGTGNGLAGLSGGNDGVLLVAINRSECDVDYSAASAGMLVPLDMRLFTLAISSAEPAYPAILAEEEFRLSTNIGTIDFNSVNVNLGGQRYYSLPQDAGGDAVRPTITDADGNAVTDDFDSDEYAAACLGIPLPPPDGGSGGNPPAAPAPAPGGDGNARDLAVIGLGVGVVGFMAAYLSGGDFSLFNFAPDFGYSATESGYSVNAGGRLNFRKDEWHLYAVAGQGNANGNFGDFRYESGGEYAADFWTAAFSETVQGETADYNFALSADYKGGIWRLSPTYRLHSKFAEEEFDTQNSLNLHGELLWNRWTIRPSAGFNWRRTDEFGKSGTFSLQAVRRF